MIKGLQKLTLLDYPGQIAATVFLGGCNMRCPFCHNASLVIPEKQGATMPDEEFFSFLESRKGKIRAVCISGGEPTLYPGLYEFTERIKSMGYLVKLDTNGTHPEILSALLADGLLDYVAMDIKNSPFRYGETVGIQGFDIEPVSESAALLMRSGADFEFRTTVCRELHAEEDIRNIGMWLSGDEKFFLQSFKDSGDLIGSGFTAYTSDEMLRLTSIIKEYIPRAEKRG